MSMKDKAAGGKPTSHHLWGHAIDYSQKHKYPGDESHQNYLAYRASEDLGWKEIYLYDQNGKKYSDPTWSRWELVIRRNSR
jgi:hypothetical protein